MTSRTFSLSPREKAGVRGSCASQLNRSGLVAVIVIIMVAVPVIVIPVVITMVVPVAAIIRIIDAAARPNDAARAGQDRDQAQPIHDQFHTLTSIPLRR